MATGENAGTWGTKTNNNLSLIAELTGGFAQVSIAGGAQTTALTVVDGATTGTAQRRMIEFTGTITGNQIVTIPNDVETFYILRNSTSGSYTVQFKYATGSGDTFTFSATNKGDKILDQLINKSKHIRHRIEFFHNKDECPTCQQDIDPGFKERKINEEQSEFEDVSSGIDQLRQVLEEKDQRLEQINNVQKQINDLQHKMIDKQSLYNSKTMYKTELEKQVTEVRDNESLISQSRASIEEQQVASDALYEKRSEAVKRKAVIDLATKLLKDTGIKSRIVKQYVPVINKLINKYLASMDFFVQFELDENFNEIIRSRYRDEFSYASFSEGEKMRIDLSLLFAWRAIAKLKNSASTNLLIMDEVFDSSLDTTGTDEFMKIVMDIVSDTNVFIISHKTDQLVDRFTNVIRFEKHKNFSRMVA
jgi:DNA repair exonuclease SbcCD ATPase subunit